MKIYFESENRVELNEILKFLNGLTEQELKELSCFLKGYKFRECDEKNNIY